MAADGAMLRKVICKGIVMTIVLSIVLVSNKEAGKSRAIFIFRSLAKKLICKGFSFKRSRNI